MYESVSGTLNRIDTHIQVWRSKCTHGGCTFDINNLTGAYNLDEYTKL